MKYLIVGLGNPGAEYVHTRHNIGFDVLDRLARKNDLSFEAARLADHALLKYKGRQYHLIKPMTFMNLSGRAVKYWLDKLKLSPAELLVVVDDIALPPGKLRLRPGGSDGGHNGLKSIQESIATTQYPRLRFGVGNDFSKGRQSDYVLSPWPEEQWKAVQSKIDLAGEIILNFGFMGLQRTMNLYNKN